MGDTTTKPKSISQEMRRCLIGKLKAENERRLLRLLKLQRKVLGRRSLHQKCRVVFTECRAMLESIESHMMVHLSPEHRMEVRQILKKSIYSRLMALSKKRGPTRKGT